MIVSFYILIWTISFVLSTTVMIRKGIDVCFWSLFSVLFPLVNTYVAIKYFRIHINISGFKEFYEQLNNKNLF